MKLEEHVGHFVVAQRDVVVDAKQRDIGLARKLAKHRAGVGRP